MILHPFPMVTVPYSSRAVYSVHKLATTFVKRIREKNQG